MPLDESKQAILWALAGVSGSLSALGSSFLLFATSYRWYTQKYSSPRDRILMGMSLLDVATSISAMFGPLPLPAETETATHAYGNTATCSAQGFGMQLGAGVPLYNAVLSLYYTMTIVFMVQDVVIRKYVEWFFHLVPLGFAFTTAIYGVVNELFNPNASGGFCWVDSYPSGCENDPLVECERGENAAQYALGFAGYPLIIGFLVVTVCMAMICLAFARQTNALSALNFNNSSPSSSSKDVNNIVSVVYVQAMMFVLAFLLTYTWGFAIKVLRYTDKPSPYALRVMNRIFLPLQGFLNALIFIRPTFLRIRAQLQKEKGKRFWCGCCFQFLWRAVKAESVDFEPPARQQRSSLLLSALQKSVQMTNKRRRSRSSMQSLEVERESTDEIGPSSEMWLPNESDIESVSSTEDNNRDTTAATETVQYISSPERNVERV